MKAIWVFFVCIISISSFAQPKGSFTVGGDFVSGNYRAVGLTSKIELKNDSSKYKWNIIFNYRWSEQSKYGESNLQKYENEQYTTGNIARSLGKIKALGFTEMERSYLRNIDLRGSLGIGLGANVIKRGKTTLNLSEVILPEYYWASGGSSNNNFTIRASTRLRFESAVGPIKLSSISLFQPALTSNRKVSFEDNLNARSTNSIQLAVAKQVTMGLLYNYSYQGYPSYLNSTVNPSQHTMSITASYLF